MLNSLIYSLVISLLINGIMFLIAFRLKSDKLTDASYALTFITLAVFDLTRSRGNDTYDLVGAVLVCVWALRIGSFLLYRVIQVGTDRRFDGLREHFLKFGKFWLGQALTVWLLMIPIALALTTQKMAWHFALIGIVIWLGGLVVEAIADVQKYHFKNDRINKGKWIASGIWRYSRHPNYFGEILIWIGIYLFALPHLSITAAIISLISPVFITVLLLFISGIPILEKSADKKWGKEVAYQQYKRQTSILIPLPRKSY